jgi:hypothetical protein
MSTETTDYFDAQRIKLAKREGMRRYGPTESARCQHGAIYTYRWTWSSDGTPWGDKNGIAAGDVEELENDCPQCNPPEDGDDDE